MASSYVNDLRLNEMATGDASGTWGETTNTNLELIAEAFSYGTEAITTNADTHTTTIADGATDPGRSMFLKYTGTLDSTCTITIGPNTVSKLWIIENGTSGSQSIIIKQGSGATVTIPSGKTKVIYSDGAGSGGAMVDAFASLNLQTSGIIESSSSIQTPLIEFTDGDDAMTIADGGGVTFAQTATFSDDIIIGDGKTIGSASDADAMTIASNGQVTFSQTLIGTALDISGDIDVDGTTNLDVVDIDGAVDMASTLAVGGAVTANAGVSIDNITIDGTEIDLSSGDLTIDVAGDIILDADGSTISMKDGGTNRITFNLDSTPDLVLAGGNASITASTSDADFTIIGNDGGSDINALTFDMSAAGAATFNDAVTLKNTLSISSASTSGFLQASSNVLQFGTSSNNPVLFFANNAERMRIDSSGDVNIGTTGAASGSHKLVVESASTTGTVNSHIALIGDSATIGQGPQILFSEAGDGQAFAGGTIGFTRTGSNSQGALLFGTRGSSGDATTTTTERMRIDSNGVLQLTTSSASGFVNANGEALELDVNRNSETGVFGDANKSHARIVISGNDGGSHIQFNTADANNTVATERMRIDSSGNLGIGTTSPIANLDVVRGSATGLSSVNARTTALFQNSNSAGTTISINAPNTGYSGIFLGDPENEAQGQIKQDHTDNTMQFTSSGGTAEMTLKDGNLGIGTASPSASLDVFSSDAGLATFTRDLTTDVSLNVSADNSGVILSTGGVHAFRVFTNSAERMRIDSSGNLLVGVTSAQDPSSSTTAGHTFYADGVAIHSRASANALAIQRTGSNGSAVNFFKTNTVVGSISITTSATTYNTSSDERLKDVTGSSRGLDVINSLNPVSFNWKADNHADEGLIAQEVEKLVPNAVNQDEDGYYQMDYSKLVTHLVKGIQEQQEQIESLKSEIASLKEK